jgi:chromosome segregation ATPase
VTESTIESAKLEVDCQRVSDHLNDLQSENDDLAAQLKACQRELETLNKNCTDLQTLLNAHGLADGQTGTRMRIMEDIDLVKKPPPEVNQGLITQLWGEQEGLLEGIAELEEQLHSVQKEQMRVMHERARLSVRRY